MPTYGGLIIYLILENTIPENQEKLTIDQRISPNIVKELEEMGWEIILANEGINNPDCMFMIDRIRRHKNTHSHYQRKRKGSRNGRDKLSG